MNIIGEEDTDFEGSVNRRKKLKTVLTKQEHFIDAKLTALEYILNSVPHYSEFKKILNKFEQGHLDDTHLYMEAVEYFSDNGYYHIDDLILGTLSNFQISASQALGPLTSLSGGEKRFVELVRMMYSKADLLLIDEPTNHMDYVGKAQFIAWMKATKEGILVVTHDRDVLQYVDRIIELKDRNIHSFKGNYDDYLKQNTANTKNSVVEYHNQLNRLAIAKKRVEWGLQMRAKSKAWRIKYDHWLRDYEKIKAETVKPSFWIDQESVEELDVVVSNAYQKFKEKNIKINTHDNEKQARRLLAIKNLSLGYVMPLFTQVNFKINHATRVFIKGRNGAGKSTLVQTILAYYRNQQPKATIFAGQIEFETSIRVGEYEQEIDPKYLPLKLEDAIYRAYESYGLSIDNQSIKGILAEYLFDPIIDAQQKISNLSGGQKARFQLIKMFANKPNLLILDEPTNHLDLPSIEELETALQNYGGGILYISHDTNFIRKLGGETIEI